MSVVNGLVTFRLTMEMCTETRGRDITKTLCPRRESVKDIRNAGRTEVTQRSPKSYGRQNNTVTFK